MDDVIERMVDAMYRPGLEVDKDDILSALRAVHDTHRLVPVEPTEEIRKELRNVPQAIAGGDWPYVSKMRITPTWRDALNAAPDYTETDNG